MVRGAEVAAPDYGVAAVAAVVLIALVASLAEEPGWRGTAADAWQPTTRPVWAAAGIGALWSLWHLPLHFIEDSWYHDIGLGSVRFWLVHLFLVQLGVLFIWLTNGSGGSVLIAVLAHTALNVTAGIVPESDVRDVVAFVVVTVLMVAVIVTTKGRLAFPDRWAAASSATEPGDSTLDRADLHVPADARPLGPLDTDGACTSRRRDTVAPPPGL
jgi:membrane protease YdiL (CAAX protease family)